MGQLDLNIDGYPTIKVDESFASLSPDEQRKTVDEILAQLGGPTAAPQGDTSMGTAFKHGELMSRANTLDYVADVNEAMQDGLYGRLTRAGQEAIGNPIREALGFAPIDNDAYVAQGVAANRARADQAQQEAQALNYRSLTTDDVSGVGSALKYGTQKIAESAPYMMTAMAAPMVTPLLTSGEVNAELREIEGLDQDKRVALASTGGVIMALLENLGAGVVLKGVSKEVAGKLGVKGVREILQRKGLGRIAAAFTTGATVEGLTETAQEGVKMGTAIVAGKDISGEEARSRFKESFFAGFSAGGGVRGTGQTVVETGKAAQASMDAMTSMKNIHGGDTEAMADVARDVQTLATQFTDRNPTKNLNDAKQTLDDLHTRYMKEFDAAKRRAKAAGVDINSADFATAERRAKNKAKNEASNADIEFLNNVDPELGAIARRLNIITRFNQKGVKGGVSQYTDLLNPMEGLRKAGTFGRGVGSTQAVGSGIFAFYNPILSGSAVLGGRIVDRATGARNRVSQAIKKYGEAPGINVAGQGQTQQAEQGAATSLAEQEAARQATAMAGLRTGTEPAVGSNAEGQVAQATGLNRKQQAQALRVLRRTRPDLAQTIDQYQAHLEGKQAKVGNTSADFYALQDAIRKTAQELGMETANANTGTNQVLPQGSMGPNGIINPMAYQATVDNAMRAADVAVQNAPTPELAQRANSIANARSQVAKRALLEQTLAENPEHKDYIKQILEPLVDFGPKQESRFSGVPGAQVIEEELDAGRETYGEPMVMLNHGTSKKSAQAIEDSGFSTPRTFAATMPQEADAFAQTTMQTKDNGRVTMMWPQSIFEKLLRNGMIKREPYKSPFGQTITEYVLSPNALAAADIFRSRSLHKSGNKITDVERAQLVADALGNGFNVALNASEDAYYRRQQLITLTANGDKRKVLHEIFHAIENRLTPEEMQVIKSRPEYKQVMQEVQELYPELDTTAQMLEGLAETAARIQDVRGENTGAIKYIVARIKDLIEAFKNLIDGNGFNTVNSILDDVYTGKTYQRQVNEHYAQLYVPDVAYAKKDKAGGPMVAKRLKRLEEIEQKAASAKERRVEVNMNYDGAMQNIAENLGLPSITPEVLIKTFSRITPSTDMGMIAADYLRAIGVMDDAGVVTKPDPDMDMEEAIQPYREDFLTLLKAMQKAGIIGDFGLAFRTSAGGRLYPVHMIEPTLPELVEKAELNNISKFENRAKPTHWGGKPKINGHPLGIYDNTEVFIEREQKQALVINDKIYEMMDKMQSTPQTHRGLDLIYKKDGTTDSAYTLASAEAIKQYRDNKNEDTGGMTPVFMKRQAQDRLRIDTLNGSASYQGKAGKAIWEFPNWEPLGETGFEQFLHSLRDHFGISNELPYNMRAGFLFGTVAEYMQLTGRPVTDVIPEADLQMPLIDYLVNAYGQDGSYVYSHTRGGTPKLFLDKQSGTTLYQKNHAIFDVAEHGFEMQRAAVELGRMRAFLENIIPDAKKMSSSELFMRPEAQAALADFKSSYPVWFDGTSSSYQLHAVLTGDANLAAETNIGPMDPDGPGGDLYRPGAEMLERTLNLPQTKTRKITKKFISNRRSYGQVKLTAMKSGADEIAKSLPEYADSREGRPQEIKDSLKQIQNDLELDFDTKFRGAAMAEGVARAIASTMFDIQGQDGFAVRVPLPDGDVAVYTGKLPDSAKKRVKWELDSARNIAVPVYKDKLAITGFAAFLNHALDAYVQRELARRLRQSGASGFMHTHDAFATHAKHGETMRELYWSILRDIANSPIYQQIAEANGLNPASVTVKFNIMTPEGSQTIQAPMSEVLQQIEQQKQQTFGTDQEPNMYALS
tara:strand:- start:9548 stop:15061 length:5514 start_codon:yes stop_codon:yes gene_type:complete